jgi:hypothetical protein
VLESVAPDVVEQRRDVGIAAVDPERVGTGQRAVKLALVQPQGLDAMAAGGAGRQRQEAGRDYGRAS